jgi:hypothetical protein
MSAEAPLDPSAALVELRERVLREGDFLWADWLGPQPGTVRPLLPQESFDLFGTTTPSREQFAAADLLDIEVERWSGRCQAVYDGDRPVAIGFWGVSGD